MSINNYRIVGKSFEGERRYRPGEAIDVSNFRNIRGLEEARYIRKPNSEEDFNLINKAIEGAELSAPKRGRPSKDGGGN